MSTVGEIDLFSVFVTERVNLLSSFMFKVEESDPFSVFLTGHVIIQNDLNVRPQLNRMILSLSFSRNAFTCHHQLRS